LTITRLRAQQDLIEDDIVQDLLRAKPPAKKPDDDRYDSWVVLLNDANY
jgi:hypothetical protein